MKVLPLNNTNLMTSWFRGDNLAAYAARFIEIFELEPGIVEFRCQRCQSRFIDPETSLKDLLHHLKRHLL